ncbi:MAG: nicotinate (nicotinamide) nucleotide adenylyltransferase [Acholeplasmataceae bacterium]|nr:nicotinate (nicotinamide) nucleotide adenylyltransferase [Acholeplasmataceae bacterium]
MILVYGGSFNPPTLAHQAILEKLKNLYPEAKIIVVPVGDDYRKSDLAPFFHRYEMVKLMISSLCDVVVSSIEGYHPFEGTIETLNRLSKAYDHLYVIMGEDQLSSISKWIRADELLNKYPFIIMKRKINLSQNEKNHPINLEQCHMTYIDFDMDISSSMFRVNPKKQKELIPNSINKYIEKHQLYKE